MRRVLFNLIAVTTVVMIESRTAQLAKRGQISDPDGILARNEFLLINEYLFNKGNMFISHPCPPAPAGAAAAEEEEEWEKTVDAEVEIQYAVALKRNLAHYRNRVPADEDVEQSAKEYAQKLHDDWGVGEITECGGTGVLLFLSEEDRVVYVSRGKALEEILTDDRLDRTIANMKPLLRRRLFGQAVIGALQEIEVALQSGKPGIWEKASLAYIGPLLWISAMSFMIFWKNYKQLEERRSYARVASHLNEIDRARAEALQGRFLASSCPICLEDFSSQQEQSNDSSGSPANNENSNGTAPTGDNNSGDNGLSTSQNQQQKRIGFDGLPLKLLRCGHVFCDTCWAEWVNNGQGHVDRCPVCQQDVSERSNEPTESNNDTIIADRVSESEPDWVEVNAHIEETNELHRRLLLSDEERNRRSREEEDNGRIIRQFHRERNFRLARLSERYPRFIRPQQVQRWTQTTFDGTLSRDPGFVGRDPSLSNNNNNWRGSGNSNGRDNRSGSGFDGGGGFGGGTSGGGRGGRW